MVARPLQITYLVCAKRFENLNFVLCEVTKHDGATFYVAVLGNAMEYNAAYERLVLCLFFPHNRILD